MAACCSVALPVRACTSLALVLAAPAFAGGETIKLSGPMQPEGFVSEFHVEFDQQNVLFAADMTVNNVRDLYTTPVDGSGQPYNLTAPLEGAGDVVGMVLAANAKRAVFRYYMNTTVVRLYGVRTEPIEAPILLASSASIHEPLLVTSDGERVLYCKGDWYTDDLYSAALDGSSPPVLLFDQGAVRSDFQLTPDEQIVVFRTTFAGPVRIYMMPVDGSGPAIRLDAPFDSVERFLVSPDGSRVVYTADTFVNDRFELFSVPLDESEQAELLSSAPVDGGAVQEFAITAGGLVVYRGDVVADGQFELFSVPLVGDEPPLRLTALLAGRSVESDFVVSQDGQRVFYRADAETDGVPELYSVRTDGSGIPFQLSGPLVFGGRVSSFLVTPDASRVVFLANKRFDGVFELFARSVASPAYPLADPPEFPTAVLSYRLDPEAQRVVYHVYRQSDRVRELFAVRLDGTTTEPLRLNDHLPAHREVLDDFVPLANGSVLYRLDQEQHEFYELFAHVRRPDGFHPAQAPARTQSVVR